MEKKNEHVPLTFQDLFQKFMDLNVRGTIRISGTVLYNSSQNYFLSHPSIQLSKL